MNYEYGYDFSNFGEDILNFVLGFILIVSIISLIISIIFVIGEWKAFKKAGKPGWAALIPIYNNIIMLEIADLPLWYLLLYLVPFANIYVIFKTFIEFAQKYGKSTGFGVAMVFFPYIFMPIIGFGSAQYIGVKDASYTSNVNQNNNDQNEYNPNSSSKYCPNCGSQLAGETKFCTNCGHQF